MRRAVRLVLLAAAADAAAKFALEKKGQKVLNVKLYETGYTFTNRGDKEKKPQTLREISGCSFGKKRDNGRREITLVEDKGYVIRNSRSFWHTSTGRASIAPAAARSAATFDLRDCMLPILLPRFDMVAVNLCVNRG